MKVTLVSIHPRITTLPTFAPPDGVIRLDPVEGGRFKCEVDEDVASVLVAVSRKDEFVVIATSRFDDNREKASASPMSPSATLAAGGKEPQSAAVSPSPSSAQFREARPDTSGGKVDSRETAKTAAAPSKNK
jgi:hypothetical protein